MDLKLVVIGGKNAGRVIPIAGQKFLIGRAEDCHLRPNSDLVSRHHCVIMIGQQTVTVRDFGSRNGTHLNGERIQRDEPLRSGDRLRVGPLEFEVLLKVGLAGQKKPRVQSLPEAAARTVESASAKPPEEDLDITEWVTETVDGNADTKAMNTAQTGTVAMNTPTANEQEATPQGEQDKKQKKKKPDSKSPSGIDAAKRPKAADSQSAAAETLRAFFNRK
jgi:pSer/pThr/pTyr-binding forkhead associated (FHA) protein